MGRRGARRGDLFTVLAYILAVQLGWQSIAFWTAVFSLAMYLINVLLMDVPWALIHHHAFGDTSGLGKSRSSRHTRDDFDAGHPAHLVWYVMR